VPTDRRTRSYSQLSQYNQCPRQFELSRIARVPRKPGWWFPGGTAVHATIERYLREAVKEQK
jgi:putative RecB family exonuclease